MAAIAAATVVTGIGGCSSDDGGTPATSAAAGGDVVRMWIQPELAECTGVGPMECLQVSYTEDGEPQLF